AQAFWFLNVGSILLYTCLSRSTFFGEVALAEIEGAAAFGDGGLGEAAGLGDGALGEVAALGELLTRREGTRGEEETTLEGGGTKFGVLGCSAGGVGGLNVSLCSLSASPKIFSMLLGSLNNGMNELLLSPCLNFPMPLLFFSLLLLFLSGSCIEVK
ncbi:unnamed protein product, partial [Linum tenue]